MPISFEVTSTEIFPFVDEQIDLIVKDIHDEISKVSPDLLADAADHGISVCGGGALIFDIAERLSKQLGIRCETIDEPRLAKIKGLGQLIKNDSILVNNGYSFIFKDDIRNKIDNK